MIVQLKKEGPSTPYHPSGVVFEIWSPHSWPSSKRSVALADCGQVLVNFFSRQNFENSILFPHNTNLGVVKRLKWRVPTHFQELIHVEKRNVTSISLALKSSCRTDCRAEMAVCKGKGPNISKSQPWHSWESKNPKQALRKHSNKITNIFSGISKHFVDWERRGNYTITKAVAQGRITQKYAGSASKA